MTWNDAEINECQFTITAMTLTKWWLIGGCGKYGLTKKNVTSIGHCNLELLSN
jgi:hypothetical protein